MLGVRAGVGHPAPCNINPAPYTLNPEKTPFYTQNLKQGLLGCVRERAREREKERERERERERKRGDVIDDDCSQG